MIFRENEVQLHIIKKFEPISKFTIIKSKKGKKQILTLIEILFNRVTIPYFGNFSNVFKVKTNKIEDLSTNILI